MSESTPVVGHLQTHKQGHVGHVVFHNPSKFNAVNYQMWCDLPVAMAQFAQFTAFYQGDAVTVAPVFARSAASASSPLTA